MGIDQGMEAKGFVPKRNHPKMGPPPVWEGDGEPETACLEDVSDERELSVGVGGLWAEVV